MQTTSNILMIRPVAFGFNAETAVNNAFQRPSDHADVNAEAQHEFDDFVDRLRARGINVMVPDDQPLPHTPDSIFPNNWVSFHEDGSVFLYPMFAENRRKERLKGVLEKIGHSFAIRSVTDLTAYENDNRFLEGTGSMVPDRKNRLVYACISQRTDEGVLQDFCQRTGFSPVTFTARDENDVLIYHTNVMMCMGDQYVVVCLDCIASDSEKEKLVNSFNQTGKTIVPITFQQMHHFAGNMLQVHNNEETKLLVMSTRAYRSLQPAQVELLESFNSIIHAPLDTIETNGGGSARCMMAEIFLESKKTEI